MKVGDLILARNIEGTGRIGLVVEEEEYEGEIGTWVHFQDDPMSWKWYSFDERYDVEVISES